MAAMVEELGPLAESGDDPGNPRFAEREVARLTEKMRAVQPSGPIHFG